MRRFLLRRVAFSFLMLLVTTAFVFGLSRAAGDPRYLYLNEYSTAAQWEQWGEAMGLNRPLVVQYADWLWDALRLDFGNSIQQRRSALELVLERAPATLRLAGVAFLFALLVSLPFGVLSAVKRGTVLDYSGRVFALLGQSMPGFWMGIVLIMIFAVELGWLPTGRQEHGIRSYVLPAITLGWYPAAGLLRLTRSSMLEVLDAEYMKMARAKGVGGNMIVWKHAFRNALIGPITFSGFLIAGFVTGAVITENVFSWPGLGQLGIQAVSNNDFPVMVAVVFVTAGAFVAANLIVDLLYAAIDPRIRFN